MIGSVRAEPSEGCVARVTVAGQDSKTSLVHSLGPLEKEGLNNGNKPILLRN